MDKTLLKLTISKEIELTDRHLQDIFCTALEGGIGYWACLLNQGKIWEQAEAECDARENGENSASYGYIAYYIVCEMNKKIRFKDEQDGNKIIEFGMEELKHAIQLYYKERGDIKDMIEEGSFDSIEADCLFQFGAFGEVVYG